LLIHVSVICARACVLSPLNRCQGTGIDLQVAYFMASDANLQGI